MALTLLADDGTSDELAATLTVTSVTHTAPFWPHAFTCTVWVPPPVETWAFRFCPFTVAVWVLLSSEYPSVVTLCVPHQLAKAESVNGEETSVPFPGL